MPEQVVVLNDLDSYQLFKDEIIRLNPSLNPSLKHEKTVQNILIYMFSCLIRLLLLC